MNALHLLHFYLGDRASVQRYVAAGSSNALTHSPANLTLETMPHHITQWLQSKDLYALPTNGCLEFAPRREVRNDPNRSEAFKLEGTACVPSLHDNGSLDSSFLRPPAACLPLCLLSVLTLLLTSIHTIPYLPVFYLNHRHRLHFFVQQPLSTHTTTSTVERDRMPASVASSDDEEVSHVLS